MSSLLFVFLGVLVVPLWIASWRASLAALTAQGFLMMCIAGAAMHGPVDYHDVLRGLDLVLVRGLAAPVALGLVLRAHRVPTRMDLIPPNILWWTLVMGALLAAFNFSEALVPAPGPQQTLVAVVTMSVLVAFVILATQPGIVPQVFAVFHLENAIALLELGGGTDHSDPVLQLVETGVLIVTIALCRWYLTMSLSHPVDELEEAPAP